MGWVAPSTRAAGSVLTAAIWNQDAVANPKFLAKPPSVRVEKSTEQSIDNAVWRSLEWDAEDWDTDTMWSSTAPTQIFINTAGKYLVTAGASFAASTNNHVRNLGILIGGSSTGVPNAGIESSRPQTGSQPTRLTYTTILSLTSTQYLRVQVQHDVASAHNIEHSSQELPFCSVLWVSS